MAQPAQPSLCAEEEIWRDLLMPYSITSPLWRSQATHRLFFPIMPESHSHLHENNKAVPLSRPALVSLTASWDDWMAWYLSGAAGSSNSLYWVLLISFKRCSRIYALEYWMLGWDDPRTWNTMLDFFLWGFLLLSWAWKIIVGVPPDRMVMVKGRENYKWDCSLLIMFETEIITDSYPG